MSASEWEIRNSASLTFTSLVVRTVGFKNVLKVLQPHPNRCHAQFSVSFIVCHWMPNCPQLEKASYY